MSLPVNSGEDGIVAIHTATHAGQAGIDVVPDAARDGWMRACSLLAGSGHDNPSHPLSLTGAQRAKAISATYRNVASTRFAFSISSRPGEQPGGRNFLVGGASNVKPINDLPDCISPPQWACSRAASSRAPCLICQECTEAIFTTPVAHSPASNQDSSS